MNTLFASLCALALSQVHAAEGSYPDYMDASSEAARRGYDIFAHKTLPVAPVFGRMTDKEFDLLSLTWPERLQAQLKAETENEDDPAKRQATLRRIGFKRYGLIESPFKPGTPLGYNADDQGSWEITCAACHGGPTPQGQMYLGQPNPRIDLQTLVEDQVVFMTAVYPSLPSELQEQVLPAAQKARRDQGLAFTRTIDPKGERVLNQNRGVADVMYSVMFQFLVRDAEMNPVDVPTIVGNFQKYMAGRVKSVDVDIRPWWYFNLPGKTTIDWDGWMPKTAKSVMIAGIPLENSADPNFLLTGEGVKALEKGEYQDAVAYFGALKPPRFKASFADEAEMTQVLAARGRGYKLFRRQCAGCHGQYSPEGETLSYPNAWIMLDTIETDSERLTSTLPKDFREYLAGTWMGRDNQSGEARGIVTNPNRGYVAPPLTGVWASAPYFHNGSVPTLYHVLHPDERPTLWRVTDYDAYDAGKVGFVIIQGDAARAELDAALGAADQEERLDGLPTGFRQNQARREYFDSSRPGGKSVQGHESPLKGLKPGDKADLLEYLKVL